MHKIYQIQEVLKICVLTWGNDSGCRNKENNFHMNMCPKTFAILFFPKNYSNFEIIKVSNRNLVWYVYQYIKNTLS